MSDRREKYAWVEPSDVEAIATQWFLSTTDSQMIGIKKVLTPEQYAPFSETVLLIREESSK